MRILAEGAGFEPAIRFPVYTLSRRAPSAARPPLRDAPIGSERRAYHLAPPARKSAKAFAGAILAECDGGVDRGWAFS
jgi:hypothetical protein